MALLSMEIAENPFRRFVNLRTVSLKTRKRNGSWVATPVNIVVVDDHAYIRTWAGSGMGPCTALSSDRELHHRALPNHSVMDARPSAKTAPIK